MVMDLFVAGDYSLFFLLCNQWNLGWTVTPVQQILLKRSPPIHQALLGHAARFPQDSDPAVGWWYGPRLKVRRALTRTQTKKRLEELLMMAWTSLPLTLGATTMDIWRSQQRTGKTWVLIAGPDSWQYLSQLCWKRKLLQELSACSWCWQGWVLQGRLMLLPQGGDILTPHTHSLMFCNNRSSVSFISQHKKRFLLTRLTCGCHIQEI